MHLLFIFTMTITTTKTISCCETTNSVLDEESCNVEMKHSTRDTDTMSSDPKNISVNFEVYGRVQGVFFRKYTQKQAQKLGLGGWCMNTENGTVQGNMQGTSPKITEMKSWLQSVGSPQSRIDKVVFSSDTFLKDKPVSEFSIRK